MKKVLFFLIYILLFLNHSFADERKDELDKLFKELKINNSNLTFEVEQKIWKIWSTHPQKKDLTKLLNKGSKFLKKINYTKQKKFLLK